MTMAGRRQDSVRRRILRNAVGYWPLDGLACAFGRPGAADLTNNNVVTFSATGGPSTEIPNYAAFTAASGMYLGAPTTIHSFGNGRFGFAGWYYLNQLPSAAAFYGLTSKDVGAVRAFQMLVSETGSVNCQMFASNAGCGNATTGAATLPATTWTLVAGWCDGSRVYASCNAGAVGQLALTAIPTDSITQTFDLGTDLHDVTPNARFLDGRISHAILISRPWEQQELAYLYNNGRGRDLRKAA